MDKFWELDIYNSNTDNIHNTKIFDIIQLKKHFKMGCLIKLKEDDDCDEEPENI